jgi:hypothetical protein
LSAGFIDISKVEGNRAKARYVIDLFKHDPLSVQVEQVNLEASLSGFAGPSNRAVVVQLARWNAVLEYVLEDFFKRPVNLVNVSTARKQLFGKARIKGIKPKAYVKMELDKLYDMTPWIVYNKVKHIDKRVEDVYDAAVIALYAPIRSDKYCKETQSVG